jgi:RimJ/RimL family protein N-acetyltransferase
VRLQNEMLKVGSQFLAVRDSTGLIGFCSFGTDGRVPGGTYDDSATDVGAGMDPARTGHGLGCQFLQAVVDHVRRGRRALYLRRRLREIFDEAHSTDEDRFLAIGPIRENLASVA